MRIIKKITERIRQQLDMPNRLDSICEALGRIESRLNLNEEIKDPRQNEFKVYSQWGEDGIIDYLCQTISIPVKTFVEFGVENYTEANTLFLLKHRNWRGLVIDGSIDNINSIRTGKVYWRYDLQVCERFITRDNIDDIIRLSGLAGELGLLSVDIDGNDYWIWESINCVQPAIVVCEYNSLFGPVAKVSIPYKDDFYRTVAHSSNLYYGASISAMNYLADSRGYCLVAGNSAGNNVFFVRKDLMGPLKVQTPEQAYVKAAFREARTSEGQVDLLTFEARQNAILELPVVQVDTMRQMTLKDAL
jgi:hypothetical protein